MSQLLKDELRAALVTYERNVADGTATESRIDELFRIADRIVPHARLTDLMFYPERERELDALIEEACRREENWQTLGNFALLSEIGAQMQMALDDPTVQGIYRHHAVQTLHDVMAEIANARSGSKSH